MRGLNKVTLIGNLGRDPEVRYSQAGAKIVNFSLATSESWKDKHTGERRERTEWHRVVIFAESLGTIAENYLRKGSKVYVEGKLQTRDYEKEGQKHFVTEVVLQPYQGQILMLDSKPDGGFGRTDSAPSGRGTAPATSKPTPDPAPPDPDLDDEIPF